MTLDDIFQKHIDIILLSASDKEGSSANAKVFDKEFNEKYKIVPKEQWCVLFYMPWEGGEPDVTGQFDSEEEAKLFITKWEERREAYIKQYLKENPNEDEYDIPSGPCLKAKKLGFVGKNQDIIDEIRKDPK